MTASGWWFEDAIPGETFRHPGGRTVADADHVWLAWVTNNASDIHGNSHLARTGVFGRPVVLGALTVAIVVGLAEPAEDPSPRRLRLSPGGWESIRLGRPVFAGDTIFAESTIHSTRPHREGRWGRVHRTIRGLDQHGATVVEIEEMREVLSRSAEQRIVDTPEGR